MKENDNEFGGIIIYFDEDSDEITKLNFDFKDFCDFLTSDEAEAEADESNKKEDDEMDKMTIDKKEFDEFQKSLQCTIDGLIAKIGSLYNESEEANKTVAELIKENAKLKNTVVSLKILLQKKTKESLNFKLSSMNLSTSKSILKIERP